MIMKRVLTFIGILFCLNLYSQDVQSIKINPAEAVKASKLQGKIFEKVALVKSSRQDISTIRPELKGELADFQVIEVPDRALKRLTASKKSEIALDLPLFGDNSIEIELVEADIFADDFVVRTSSSESPQEVKLGKFYRGVIKGEDGSLASLSLLDGELRGIFSSPESGNWVISRMESKSDRYLLYRDEDKVNPASFTCHTKESGIKYGIQDINTAATTAANKCTGIYFEVDNDIYNDKGGTTQTVNYVSAIFNEVATLYANDDLNIEISEIFVWDSNSPYSGQSSSSLLNQFQQRRTSFNGDLAQLLSYKASGGIAVLDGLCHPYNSAKMSFSSIGSSFRNVPDYSFTVMVVAHELGHLFGSHHTHACVWNGNGTAIDACAGFVEGNCGSAPVPQNGGTIMSYCHLRQTGINFTKGFGTQPGNVIRNNVANASCLQTCSGGGGDGGNGGGGDGGNGGGGDGGNGGGGDGGNGGGDNGCDGNLVTVIIVLDDYATETSWKITGDNNEVFADGGPYQKGAGGSTEEIEVCLPDGCYYFEISDEYGDGICCSYGDGSYQVVDANGEPMVSGGDFSFSEVKEFCVDEAGGQGGGNDNNCVSLNFNNYDIISYGGPQDLGSHQIQDQGKVLAIGFNAWKAIEFRYQVTPRTILQFDFASTKEGEIHGIGLDNNKTISSSKTFKVHGTQNWGHRDFDDYPNNGDWKTYRIPVGKYNTGQFDYLFFVADDDSQSGDGNSYFTNVKVYEQNQCFGLPEESRDLPKTDLELNLASKAMTIYPNPTAQNLTLEFQSKVDLTSTVYIYNAIGQVIKTMPLATNQGFNRTNIDLDGLADGTYLLRLETGGREMTKRFNILR